jgi:5'-3' exoribonuclease 2
MGVPGFFKWLQKNYKKNDLILPSIKKKVNVLYLDANCLFHPQCFKTLDHFPDWKTTDLLEKKMFKRIIAYIDFLCNYVSPDELYISVDGVAPMAKMNQQRKRRYRSKDDTELKNNIKLKHNKTINKSWSNTVITPGTIFMENLHNKILSYISSKKIKVTYSSYHTPGEGEHKILQDIKSKTSVDDCYVIYGLDADLIFLASASSKENIYLLREAEHFGKQSDTNDILRGDFFDDVAEDLNYVCIDTLKKCIDTTIYGLLRDTRYQDINFNSDFIFICYLLGNDFLPHLPSVNIKTGGLDFLIDCYTNIYKFVNTNLISKDKDGCVVINDIFLDLLLKEISKFEHYYFTKRLPGAIDQSRKRRCPSSDPYEKELWDLENMRLIDIIDPIKLGEGNLINYKFRYYDHYFKISESQDDHILDMCTEYIKGIVWVSKYYFEQCPCWEWQYPYTHAPFISDLSKMYSINQNMINELTFKGSCAINPCTQLLSVLPPANYNLLPVSYQRLVLNDESDIIDMYPCQIELDMIDKFMYYQCIPYIPCVDIDRIKEAVKNIKLSENEIIRNKLLDKFKN